MPSSTISTSGSLTQSGTDILFNSVILTFPVSISSSCTITLAENLTFYSVSQYFIIASNGINIQGDNYTITINNISGYTGLIQCNTAYTNININNLGVLSVSSSLNNSAGWIVQASSGNDSGITCYNCYSTGEITNNSGGIFGQSSSGTATNCYSTGTIGTSSGGIFGPTSSGTATNCYSTGVNAFYSGGIFGGNSSGTATNCYSTGAINASSGGIFGDVSGGTATNCYSTGEIIGGGGIFGSSAGTAINCYCIGGTIIGGNTQTNCYAALETWNNTHANTYMVFGTTWFSINSTTPWLLKSFNSAIYNPSSATTTSSSYTTSSGLFSTNSVLGSPTYLVYSSTNNTPTVNSSTGQLTFTGASGTSLATVFVSYTFNSTYVGYNINTFSLTVNSSVPCFLRNTKILTGEFNYKLVQDLKVGDTVSTPDGRIVPVLRVDSFTCAASPSSSPFLIPKGYKTINGFVCLEDLYLSPDHGILIDHEIIVPVKYLGLKQETTRSTLEYFHITLPNFFTDNVLANGLACESYGGNLLLQSQGNDTMLNFNYHLIHRICENKLFRKLLTSREYNVLMDKTVYTKWMSSNTILC